MECELRFAGLRHRGVVVDASPDGLFVRTAAKPTGAGELELRVYLPGRAEATLLRATPVRMQLAPEPRTGATRCGVALRVVAAPESYAAFFLADAPIERPSDRCSPAPTWGPSRAPVDGSRFESRRAPAPTLVLAEELVIDEESRLDDEILLLEEIALVSPAVGIEPPGRELPSLQTPRRVRCALCHRDDRPVLGGVCVWCHGHERG